MAISSLSKENTTNLIELSSDLRDVLYERDSVKEEAKKLIDRMQEIEVVQRELDEKSSKIVDIETPMEAKEFQELLERVDKLSTEKNELYKESKIFNNRLNELENIEKKLKDEMNRLIEIKDDIVDDMGIIDREIPNKINKVDPDSVRIIESSIELSNYITDLSEEYKTKIKNSVINSDYNQLKEKVDKYSESEDDELKLVEKTPKNIESPQNVEVEEFNETIPEINDEQEDNKIEIDIPSEQSPIPTLEIPKVEETILPNTNIDIPNVNVEIPTMDNINEPKNDNIIPLESVLSDNPVNNVPETAKNRVIKFNDKVVPNKVARATKKKINEVIKPNFEGTFAKVDIISTSEPINNNTNTQFNIDNFLNNKAA